MKWVKRAILVIVGVLLLSLMLIVGVLGLAWTHPQDTWAFVQRNFLPKDLSVSFSHVGFDVHRLEGLDFQFDFQLSDLKIIKGEPAVNLVAEQVRVAASVFPKNRDPLLVVHAIELRAASAGVLIIPPSTDPGPAQNPFQQVQKIVAMLNKYRRLVQTENLDIDVHKLAFAVGDAKPVTLGAKVNQSLRRPRPKALNFEFHALVPAEAPFEIEVLGLLDTDRLGTPADFVEAQAQVHTGGLSLEQRVRLSVSDEESHFQAEGPVTVKLPKKKLQVQSQLKVVLRETEASLHLEASVDGLPGPVVRVKEIRGDMQVPFDANQEWSGRPSTFTVQAPVELFFIDAQMRRPFEKECHCRVPERLNVQANGDIWFPALLGRPSSVKKAGVLNLKVESVRNELLSLELAARAVVQKVQDKFELEPVIDSLLVIHSFQGLRRFLDAKNILIPAPFQVLDGEVRVRAQGPVGSTAQGTELPILIAADVASKNQRIRIDSITQVRINPGFSRADLGVSVKIDEFQIELPPLEPLAGVPAVVPDSRIQKTPRVPPKKNGFQVNLTLDVETQKAGAIRLLSKLAKPSIPISLKIQHSQATSSAGFIAIEPFTIEYLRRKVFVEKLRLGLDSAEQGVFPVNGRLRVDQTQYKVFLDLGGTVKNPQVQLSSEPYLPREEIISVLLYDRTSNELLSADAEAAGHFDAALADRAIGLFGLWAFATTPIRSFSYNPVTKVYAATVMLADDLSAGIGTNWEETTQLELRKRVSKRWMLTASWNPSQESTEGGQLVLQWEKRF